jgi:hypothetical protein
MSQTGTALVIKLALTFIFAAIAFYLFGDNSISWIFIISLLGTVINYFIGDLFVLPRFGNLVASIGDGIMGGLVAYLVDIASPDFVAGFTSLVIFSLTIAVGEYFFHQYLFNAENVAP